MINHLFHPTQSGKHTFVLFLLIVAVVLTTSPTHSDELVQIVFKGDDHGPARHGIEKLKAVLATQLAESSEMQSVADITAPYTIIAGLVSDPEIISRIITRELSLPREPESFIIQRTGTQLLLCGADPVGLMYAALDTAERISWATPGTDLFEHVVNTQESPYLKDRVVSTYTMNRSWWEERLYDPDYWTTYFDMLAQNRFNSYLIIFGYECAGFMAPPYPYFFNVDGFPNIKFNHLTAEEQAKNTRALQEVIELAHDRGIRVQLGIWDHIYRGAVQAGGIDWAPRNIDENTPNVVTGVTAENLQPYTKAALQKLLEVFPEIDGLQFRMHWESGLTREEIPPFWREVFSMLQELKPGLTFELRAKDLPDEVIENAIAEELPFRIATKFWMEQLGLPFHPTHVNRDNQRDRRHGYADLTRYPKQFNLHWRIWTGGTTRLLLWGDPDFVERMMTQTIPIYGGNSFEVNEMLATKMLGVPHEETPFEILQPDLKYYDYEIERYWYFYQLWGRLSYNPEAESGIWRQSFVKRFGPSSGPVLMDALHKASGILPRIVAASYNYFNFPTTRGWAEMMRLGNLRTYAFGTGTDTEQFMGYRDAADLLLEDGETTLCMPQQTAAWFDAMAREVLEGLATAVALPETRSPAEEKEFQSTCTDLRILAGLAKYHAARMPAAVWYDIYRETDDRFALDQAIAGESAAISAWHDIVDAADGVYGDFLRFGAAGMTFPANWQEELEALEAGLQALQKESSDDILDVATRGRILEAMKRVDRPAYNLELSNPPEAVPGQEFTVTATVTGTKLPRSVQLRYRHLTQFEDYESVRMTLDATSKRYTASIPGDFITTEWDLMYFIEVQDHEGRGIRLPDFEIEMPYVVVPVQH